MKLIFKNLKSVFKNQKGIALLLVLSSLSVLTIAVVEFTYSARINYRLAVQAKERLQAYYLAKSALNFSRVVLKYNKQAQKMASDHSAQLGGMKLEPLYRMMPLSSSLLRSALNGDLSSLMGSDSTNEEGDADSGVDKEQVTKDLGMLQKEDAEKFLDFDGDFSSEITEEQSKFNLNSFYGLETKSPTYDQRKKMLLSILKLPRFDKAFENRPNDREELVHAIADWVDANDVINEFDQVQRGDEKSLYDAGTKVKSSKMLTLDELRLVHGMTDAVFEQLKPLVTVYSGTDKINICYAEDDLVKAMVYHFTHNSGCSVGSIEYDDEKMKELSEQLLGSCPGITEGVTAVEQSLGITDTALDIPAPPLSPDDDPSLKGKPLPTPPTQPDTAQANGCQFRLKNLVTEENKVFYVKASGEVGETTLTIHAVLAENGNDFKVNYFKIE